MEASSNNLHASSISTPPVGAPSTGAVQTQESPPPSLQQQVNSTDHVSQERLQNLQQNTSATPRQPLGGTHTVNIPRPPEAPVTPTAGKTRPTGPLPPLPQPTPGNVGATQQTQTPSNVTQAKIEQTKSSVSSVLSKIINGVGSGIKSAIEWAVKNQSMIKTAMLAATIIFGTIALVLAVASLFTGGALLPVAFVFVGLAIACASIYYFVNTADKLKQAMEIPEKGHALLKEKQDWIKGQVDNAIKDPSKAPKTEDFQRQAGAYQTKAYQLCQPAIEKNNKQKVREKYKEFSNEFTKEKLQQEYQDAYNKRIQEILARKAAAEVQNPSPSNPAPPPQPTNFTPPQPTSTPGITVEEELD
jgi:hypothetical protein